jgi:hypothetical protein
VIQITPQMRIVVAVDPQDFRKGIDGMHREATPTTSRPSAPASSPRASSRRGMATGSRCL